MGYQRWSSGHMQSKGMLACLNQHGRISEMKGKTKVLWCTSNSYITTMRDVSGLNRSTLGGVTGYILSRRGITVLCHRLLGKWHQTRLLLSVTSANVFCWLLNLNRASCCGWICSIIYSLPGRVQLSEHCQHSQWTHARIKNCKFFVLNESKSVI